MLKLKKKACCYGYLDGAPKEGQEVSANWQQDEHAVEVEAGGRSSGPGQSVLETRVEGGGKSRSEELVQFNFNISKFKDTVKTKLRVFSSKEIR